MNVPYLGSDARLYVSPIDGLSQWTLIVFRDKDSLRSTYLEVVALSASLFLLYLLPLVLVLLIMFFRSLYTGKRMKYLWPSANRSSVYVQSIPISIVFSVFGYRVSCVLPDRWLIPFLILLSVTALFVFIAQLKYNRVLTYSVKLARFVQRRPSINYRSLSSLALVTLVVVIGVLPALGFFRLAYNEEMALFTKYGQFTLLRSLNEREADVRAAYPTTIFKNEAAAQVFRTRRLSVDLDRYYAFFFRTKISSDTEGKALPETQGTLLLRLSQLLPLSSESSIVRHGLIKNQSADDLWSWSSGKGPTATLILQGPGVGEQDNRTNFVIESRVPKFPLGPVALLVSLIPILLILFVLIRFVLSRVFLLDIVDSSKSDSNRRISAPSGQRHFIVLGSPYTRRESLLQQATVLNLKVEATGTKWLQKLELDKILGDPTQSIAIDCFEHRIHEPQSNLQKLVLLEKLVASDRTLLVTSTVDPAEYSFDTASKQSTNSMVRESDARWARVISKFWVRYLEDVGDAHEFRSALARIRMEKNLSPQGVELFNMLARECSPRACLQDIAIGIASQPRFEKGNSEQLLDEIVLQARTYYKFLWESCSPTEKLTLAHLAVDRLLSPNDPDIPRLIRRGLIVRKRQVRFLNQSFRLFVLAESRTDDDVAVCEDQAQKGSSWQYLKVALSVVLCGLMLFLFVTQRDLYNSALIAITGIAAGLPSVFNFLNLFQSKIGSARA